MKTPWELFALRNANSQHESVQNEPESASPIRIEVSSLVDLGCAIWRLRQKTLDDVTGEPKDGLRNLARHVIVIWDWCEQRGLTIQDHTGQCFDSGQFLEVIGFQPMAGLARETVIETVRPTIYLNGEAKPILKGQVIVGTPDNSTTGEK